MLLHACHVMRELTPLRAVHHVLLVVLVRFPWREQCLAQHVLPAPDRQLMEQLHAIYVRQVNFHLLGPHLVPLV
jgi:hypothetical protein